MSKPDLTAQINAVCDEIDTRPDPFVAEAARRILQRTEPADEDVEVAWTAEIEQRALSGESAGTERSETRARIGATGITDADG
jgi:hypothetical protein